MESHAIFIAQAEQALAGAAIEHAVFFLNQIELSGGDVLPEMGLVKVRGANGADFALLLEPEQTAHGIGNRAGIFGLRLPMDDINVDIVGLQATQAGFDFLGDELRAGIAHDTRAVALHMQPAFLNIPTQTAFGRQDVLAASPGQRLADDLLAMTEAIHRRRIQQGDAQFAGAMDGADRLRIIARPPHAVAANRPTADPDNGCLHARLSDLHGAHHRLLVIDDEMAVTARSRHFTAWEKRFQEAARNPAWIGHLRAGTSGTLINKGLQGMDAGNALFTRASEHPPWRCPETRADKGL